METVATKTGKDTMSQKICFENRFRPSFNSSARAIPDNPRAISNVAQPTTAQGKLRRKNVDSILLSP
jgi:hypothetical protein